VPEPCIGAPDGEDVTVQLVAPVELHQIDNAFPTGAVMVPPALVVFSNPAEIETVGGV